MILSTHILPEVSKTCQRVVVINSGQIVAVGTPDELMRRLQGFETVLITVEGPAASIKEKFERVAGVNGVEPGESHDGRVNTWKFTPRRTRMYERNWRAPQWNPAGSFTN